MSNNLYVKVGADTTDLKKGMDQAVRVTQDGAKKMGAAADKAGSSIKNSLGAVRSQAKYLVPSLSEVSSALFGMGAAVLVIKGLSLAFEGIRDALDQTTQEQKIYNEISEEGAKLVGDEIGRVKALSLIINDETISRENRTAALKELQQKYPEYLSNLSIEKSTTEQIERATGTLTQAIIKKGRVQAAMNKITETANKELTAQLEYERELEANVKRAANYRQSLGAPGADKEALRFRIQIDKAAQDKFDKVRAGLSLEYEQLETFIARNDNALLDSVLKVKPEKATKAAKGKKTKAGKDGKPSDFLLGINDKRSFKPDLIKADIIKPYSELTDVQKEALGIAQDFEVQNVALSGSFKAIAGGLDEFIPATKQASQAWLDWRQTIEDAKVAEALKKELEAMNAMLESFIENALFNMADAMGQALVSGQDVGQAIGQALLESVGAFMQQFGQMMITTAIAVAAFNAGLSTLNPALLAIAGFALVAAGGAVKAAAAKGPEAARMAEGGIVPAGYPNDTFPALLTSGETVTPPHKLPAMGDNMVKVEVVGRMDGRDIYFSAKNWDTIKNR
jgi:hypothetical protein